MDLNNAAWEISPPASELGRGVRGGTVLDAAAQTWRARLLDAGFRKRSGDIFTRPVTDDILGWLGLNRAASRQSPLVEVNPVVGVRHVAVESMVAELLGEKPHGYAPPTLSVSLGYVMPARSYQAWVFTVDTPVESVADDLVAAVNEYGIPYFEHHDSLAAIVQAMSEGAGFKEHNVFRLPVGYLLLDELEKAQQIITASVDELGQRQDLAAHRLRAFAAAFQQRLDRSRA
ncbi:hypothetical protein [Arthrobacter sp. SLBN-112]|uniref:hypothetical protein n=1 Tax=Arthrobacter sp. SLBN-112 TaxID=2768452 RepID=UPI002810DE92|nr:hypothetical protein [Arthrobacter sp. SLBN-112]